MKHSFLDWQRPMVPRGDTSMDFEPGAEYLVYISYYLGKDRNRSVDEKADDATIKNVTGEKGGSKRPAF